MRLFPIALLIAAISFAGAIAHLNQNIKAYFDLVALLIVFGGTLAVSLMILPWDLKKDIQQSLTLLFKQNRTSDKDVVRVCLQATTTGSAPSPMNSHKQSQPELWRSVLSEGIELLNLGLSKEKVENIIEERIASYMSRRRKVVTGLRNLAKYPPAFGLMGTVLGLVNVMKGVSTGMNAKQTAFEMALALVATMYGLIVSNLILNPAGENILAEANKDEHLAHLALEAVSLYADNASQLEAQELLNSHVQPDDQIPLFQEHEDSSAAHESIKTEVAS